MIEDGGSLFLQNVGITPKYYTAQELRRPHVYEFMYQQ
jgi:hypothetical protein